MIRRTVLAAVAASVVGVAATGASASTIDFDIDVPGSSVALSTSTIGPGILCAITSCAVNASLAAGFATPEIFSLAEGETQEIDFITFTTTGAGALDLDISATLAFDSPPGANTTGTGSGFAILAGGLLTAGNLIWDSSLPNIVALANGSIITIDFQDISGIDLFSQGNSYTAKAYVTATSVVPLPAAGWLLLGGIGGLVALRRKKAA